jgi:hypothetical protein
MVIVLFNTATANLKAPGQTTDIVILFEDGDANTPLAKLIASCQSAEASANYHYVIVVHIFLKFKPFSKPVSIFL